MPAGLMAGADSYTADGGGMPIGAMDTQFGGADPADAAGMPVGSMNSADGAVVAGPGGMPAGPAPATSPVISPAMASEAASGLVFSGTWRITVGIDS